MGKIANLPYLERPREKAIRFGMENISDEELLAIILTSGYKGVSVNELSCQLITQFGGLSGLKKAGLAELKKCKGINNVKALTLLASIELHRRLQNKEEQNKIEVASPSYLYFKYRNKLIDATQEHLIIVCVNRRNEIIAEKIVYIGTGSNMPISHQDVFRAAFNAKAHAFYLIHNHPDGDIKPSIDDLFVTDEIIKAGKQLGISLLDHIIIGKEGYYSFQEKTKK